MEFSSYSRTQVFPNPKSSILKLAFSSLFLLWVMYLKYSIPRGGEWITIAVKYKLYVHDQFQTNPFIDRYMRKVFTSCKRTKYSKKYLLMRYLTFQSPPQPLIGKIRKYFNVTDTEHVLKKTKPFIN